MKSEDSTKMTSERLLRILLFVIISIIIYRKKKSRKREWEQAEDKKRFLENYSIQNERLYYWIMIICFLFFSTALALYLYFELNQLDLFFIMMFVAFALVSLLCVLNTGLWKVTVNGEDIMFRNSFGITKRYRFDDITHAVEKRSGALNVYSGNKKLFTFAENIDYLYFDIQLSQKGIPKKSGKEFKRTRSVDYEGAHKFSSNHKEYLAISANEKELTMSFFIEDEKPFAIGEKMNEINENAYMNGYNWEAFLNYYLSQNAPDVLEGMVSDSEAGTYVAVFEKNAENEVRVNKFAEIIQYVVENEDELYRIIRAEGTNIDWD